MAGSRRVFALALAFAIAGCAVQTAAPRPNATPAPTAPPTPIAIPTNSSTDVVYVRSSTSPNNTILVIDARTGETLRVINDGALSSDGATVYWTESSVGGTKTTLHMVDLASGKELRSFVVDGDVYPAGTDQTFNPLAGDGRLTRDGRFLALANQPVKVEGDWITKIAVVDTQSGAIASSVEMRGQTTFGFIAFSPDGRSVFLEQFGDGAAKMRVFDVGSHALADLTGDGLAQTGFRTAAVLSPDGRWLYRLDAGSQTTNCTSTDGPACVPNAIPPYVLAVDLVSRRAAIVKLPAQQRSDDFEKYMLWSLALTPDGSTLFAANPAVGVVDEIDTRALSVRRTATVTVSGTDDGLLASLGRAFFPVADAKRYLVGGSALSSDGRTLYAAAHDGISVIDTSTLTSRAVWAQSHQFDTMRLSADGQRLYAMDNMAGRLEIIDTTSGGSLGDVRLRYATAIIRVDSSR